MKKITIFFFIIIFTSCDKVKREYYSNGVLYKEYTIENDLYNGLYREFYENGTLKLTHKYKAGKEIDTSRYYDRNGTLKKKKIWSDTLRNKLIIYDDKSLKMASGMTTDDGKKIGKWTYYKTDKNLA